jgi:hypothetical protein
MYQTGTFTTVAGLKSTIESFCTTNGWTLTSGVLHKELSYVKLTNPDSDRLTITGANSVDFLTTPCPFSQTLYLVSGDLPATYYLFVHADPDMCVCVVNYNTVQIQVLMFGDIVKIHSSAYVGGNFFFASRQDSNYTLAPSLRYINDVNVYSGSSATGANKRSHFMPFQTGGNVAGGLNYGYIRSGFHAEIDDYIWDMDSESELFIANKNIMLTESTISSYHRSPNQWDSQAHLIPMHIQARMEDDLWGYLGYVEHIRLIRIDNYNIGDIVEIAPDSWKVFPWVKKDMTYPSGSTSGTTQDNILLPLESSGSLGFAVHYDI